MTVRNHNYSKEFEANIVFSFRHVLAIQPTERTINHVRYVMDVEELTEDEELCFKQLLSALENVEKREDFDIMSAKTIEKYLLQIPTEVFESTFHKYASKYEELDSQERETLEDGFVSGHYQIFATLSEISGFFYYLERLVRQEVKEIVEGEFQEPTPETIPQEPETEEDPEFDFTPIQ